MANRHQRELPTEAVLAIQAGRKLEAIRILREQTGMDLLQAKTVVDRAAAAHRSAHRPELPRKAAGREDSGMLRLVAVIVVLGAVAAAWLLL